MFLRLYFGQWFIAEYFINNKIFSFLYLLLRSQSLVRQSGTNIPVIVAKLKGFMGENILFPLLKKVFCYTSYSKG